MNNPTSKISDLKDLSWDDFLEWLKLVTGDGNVNSKIAMVKHNYGPVTDRFKEEITSSNEVIAKLLAVYLGCLSDEEAIKVFSETLHFEDFWIQMDGFYEKLGPGFTTSELVPADVKAYFVEERLFNDYEIDYDSLALIDPSVFYGNEFNEHNLLSGSRTFEENLHIVRSVVPYLNGPYAEEVTYYSDCFLWILYEIKHGENNVGYKEPKVLDYLGNLAKGVDFSDEPKFRAFLEKTVSISPERHILKIVLKDHYFSLGPEDVVLLLGNAISEHDLKQIEEVVTAPLPEVFHVLKTDITFPELKNLLLKHKGFLEKTNHFEAILRDIIGKPATSPASLTYGQAREILAIFFPEEQIIGSIQRLLKDVTTGCTLNTERPEEALLLVEKFRAVKELAELAIGDPKIFEEKIEKHKHDNAGLFSAGYASQVLNIVGAEIHEDNLKLMLKNSFSNGNYRLKCPRMVDEEFFYENAPIKHITMHAFSTYVPSVEIEKYFDSISLKDIKESSRCLEWFHFLNKNWGLKITAGLASKFPDLSLKDALVLTSSY